MRRIVLAAVVPAALLIAPAAASAHHHGHAGGARRHHHLGHALRHHRLVFFGGPPAPTTTAPGAPATPSTPTTPPATPTPAGKVLTFEGGVLTIELTGGEKVSGKVTEDTRLICVPATPPASGEPGDDEQGDDEQGGGDDDATESAGEDGGPSPTVAGQSDGAAHLDQSAGEDGQGWGDDGGDGAQSCETSALTGGATVLAAELNLGPSGAVWEQVVIVH